jgi:hypothetical protein
MKRFVLLGATLVVIAVAASPVFAQRQRGGRDAGGGSVASPLFLLTQKSVREELKLSAEQIKKVTELSEQRREAARGWRDLSRDERQKKEREQAKANETALAGILQHDQLKRLKQISLQQRGTRAFSDAEIASVLKLTEDQKNDIKKLQDDAQQEIRSLGQGGNRQEARQKGQQIRKDTDAKILAMLTAEQRSQWKQMTGEPFKGQIQPGFGGQRGQGRGNRGQDRP